MFFFDTPQVGMVFQVNLANSTSQPSGSDLFPPHFAARTGRSTGDLDSNVNVMRFDDWNPAPR